MGARRPSKKQAWMQFAHESGAEFVDDGFARGVRLEKKHRASTVYLDTFTVNTGKSSSTYTRVRALYVGSDDFYFKINRKTVFSRIAKAFGKKYVLTGDGVFDAAFVVKSNDEQTVRKLLSDQKLRLAMLDIKAINIVAKGNEGKFGPQYQPMGKELYYYTGGVIKDQKKLADLLNLFKLLLDDLYASDIATEEISSATLFKKQQ